jgi:hypothetical protein
MTCAQLRHVAAAPIHWAGHVLSNTHGILTVFDLVWMRQTRGGIIDITHPFATGIDPRTGGRVWRDNLLYRSRAAELPLEEDVGIVDRVMDFMRGTLFRPRIPELDSVRTHDARLVRLSGRTNAAGSGAHTPA